MPELGSAEYDLYFMAERKSRRNKDNSTLTLLISKGADNFADMTKDAALITNAMKYLEDILPMITAYDLELQITAQEDAVKKSDKKYSSLVDDGQSLEKKRKNIEKDIEDNKSDQEKQLADIEKQKQTLETLKASRKQ
jgi:serine phosphatase RsbU (regulator of sigma subunit)